MQLDKELKGYQRAQKLYRERFCGKITTLRILNQRLITHLEMCLRTATYRDLEGHFQQPEIRADLQDIKFLVDQLEQYLTQVEGELEGINSAIAQSKLASGLRIAFGVVGVLLSLGLTIVCPPVGAAGISTICAVIVMQATSIVPEMINFHKLCGMKISPNLSDLEVKSKLSGNSKAITDFRVNLINVEDMVGILRTSNEEYTRVIQHLEQLIQGN